MRHLSIIFLFLEFTINITSQIPNSFSYQAVVRDSENTLLRNKDVKIEVSIFQESYYSQDEEVVFTQILETKTNENGLISVTIGGTQEFSNISWIDGQLSIQTRIDPNGGENFTIETKQQLLSVPFAMAAQTAMTAPILESKIDRLEKQEEMNTPELKMLKKKVSSLEGQVRELCILLEIPFDVPFEEYSLEGTQCKWVNLNYDDSLIIVNNTQELEGYITCISGNYPEIDFSKHTLLFASGTTPNACVVNSNRLIQITVNNYQLEVEVLLNIMDEEGKWITALIVKKLSDESDIDLIITILKY